MKAIIYEGIDGRWYWRLKAANGRIVADGSQGYVSASNAKRALTDIVLGVKNFRLSGIKVLP